MISSLLIFLSALLWGGVHSLLAASGVKAAIQRRAGSLGSRAYRLGYNLISGISLLPVLALTALLPDRPLYAIPSPWVILTGLIQFAAVVLLAVGVLQTGAGRFLGLRQLADPASQPARLVTSGLYRYVRHPLYSAGLVLLWFTPVMSMNLLVLAVCLTVYILVGAALEERKLLAEFGPNYAEYRKRTPMFIPFP